jgi:hypothetical protein
MATSLRFGEIVRGGGRIQDSATSQAQNAIFGQGVLPSLDQTFSYGTGSGKVNMWYLARRTLATVTFDLLDLAGGLTDYKGAAITFTKIKRILLVVIDPDGTKTLRIGPQNQSAPFIGPWSGGTGATVYNTVFRKFDQDEPYAGWAVTATTADILPIYNPGASSVTYLLWLLGEV